MPIHHRLATIVGGLLLLGSIQTLHAQYPPAQYQAHQPTGHVSLDEPYGAPESPQGYPGFSPPPAMAYQPGMQFPPGALPWPEISPYDHRFEQTKYRDGLWEQKTSNEMRDYFFSLEYLHWNIKDPGGSRIGSQAVPLPDPDVTPFGFADANVAFRGFLGLPTADPALVFQVREVSDWEGLGLRWGFFDVDGTGMELNAYYAPSQSHLFSRGIGTFPLLFSGVIIDPATPEGLEVLLESTTNGALPLNDGTPDGTAVPYDRLFRVEFESETGGTGINFYATPKWSGDNWQIRPFWGLRYVYVGERFDFQGIDSGIAGIVFGEDGVPDPDSLDQAAEGVEPYETQIHNSVQSHMGGAQVGLRIDVGGEYFKLISSSAFGLLANNERHELNGFGVGNPFDPPIGGFDQSSRFRDTYQTTHVSPVFEQSLNAELHVLHLIPGIRQLRVFNSATLRVGYSALVIGEVSRPQNSINWDSMPLNPSIDSGNRENWYVHGWNFSLDWRY